MVGRGIDGSGLGLKKRRLMTANVRAAIVIAVAIILGATMMGGIYESRASGDGVFFWRINKFTGAIKACRPYADASPVCYDAKSNSN
jgi:hypothetical protein